MQYLSGWSPRSSPRKPSSYHSPEDKESPARALLKSLPSTPLLSGAEKTGKSNGLPVRADDRKSGDENVRYTQELEDEQVHGTVKETWKDGLIPEEVDATSASIHPSESSSPENSPSRNKTYATVAATGVDPEQHEIDPSPLKEEAKDRSQKDEPTDEEPESQIPATQAAEADEPTSRKQASLLSPPLPPPPRRRSSLAQQNPSKRFSTGGIGVHFGTPRSRLSTDLDSPSPTIRSPRLPSPSIPQSSPQTPTPATMSIDLSRLETNLDRIQQLLEQNATQIRALEAIQAANWERAVSMLVQNAEQIAELRKGQEKLGGLYAEMRDGRAACGHDVRRPPRKMARKVVGYVYDEVVPKEDKGRKTGKG